ncbi:SCO3374 family protein [Streptomyces sp. H51]|uniref:SCO3374 family protein n=1 Tax=Streptomyces sp. H51 TaxID=3111770 RepID=UPI002D7800A1|nr:SCO3374 family protein [Streptomyces sp. H51]
MVGSLPPVTANVTNVTNRTKLTVPLPRRPLDPGAGVRDWYENELGWPTMPAMRGGPGNPGSAVRLAVGVRFDVLDVPAEAGRAGLRHLATRSPVAVQQGRMRLLVAAGSAEELSGLLDWLEWGALALDLTALGEGDAMDAPPPPGHGRPGARPPAPGAAVWLRPPGPGREVEASLPTLSAMGGREGAPDLVRLVNTVATQCHRIRLRRARAQALAFS